MFKPKTYQEETIKRLAPVVSVCVYHYAPDLWTIPLMLHEMRPDYSFYLRRHAPKWFESICYAVPSDRVAPH